MQDEIKKDEPSTDCKLFKTCSDIEATLFYPEEHTDILYNLYELNRLMYAGRKDLSSVFNNIRQDLDLMESKWNELSEILNIPPSNKVEESLSGEVKHYDVIPSEMVQ